MSERNLRQRLRVNAADGRRTRPSQLSPSSRRRTPPMRRSVKYSKPKWIVKRCLSEPMLPSCDGEGVGDDQESSSLGSNHGDSGGVGVLYRPQTCTDVFSSTSSLPGISTGTFESNYKKDAKVVVNVTVEGSPGPVRTMVKLGCCVEETIKLVLNKYSEEQRTPTIDKSSPSSYELHQSYFSLQSLDKSELIGDTGSRSFYLRKNSSNLNTNKASTSKTSDIAPGAITSSPPPPIILVSAFIARQFCILKRRTGKILKLLLCMQ